MAPVLFQHLPSASSMPTAVLGPSWALPLPTPIPLAHTSRECPAHCWTSLSFPCALYASLFLTPWGHLGSCLVDTGGLTLVSEGSVDTGHFHTWYCGLESQVLVTGVGTCCTTPSTLSSLLPPVPHGVHFRARLPCEDCGFCFLLSFQMCVGLGSASRPRKCSEQLSHPPR